MRNASLSTPAVHLPWKDQGRAAIREALQEKGEVTSDDIHFAIGDPPHDPNQMGSLFREAVADGVIAFSGRLKKSVRRESKGRDLKVWVESDTGQASLL